jgi:hypothetical protein
VNYIAEELEVPKVDFFSEGLTAGADITEAMKQWLSVGTHMAQEQQDEEMKMHDVEDGVR